MKKHSILLGLFVLSFAGLAQTPSAESLMASYPFTIGDWLKLTPRYHVYIVL